MSEKPAIFDVPVPRALLPYLAKMRATGLYGDTPTEVLVTLIRQGIIAAVGQKIVPVQMEKGPLPAPPPPP